jgi:hypothetical protein
VGYNCVANSSSRVGSFTGFFSEYTTLVHILIDMEVGYLDEKYFLEWYEFLKYYY